MNTNEEIKFWGALSLSGIWGSASTILETLGKSNGFAEIMAVLWVCFAIFPIVVDAYKSSKE